jgi:ribosome-binding ATPase YchF (GTP1/OBG family)
MKIGIIGLPLSGRSTTFEALTRQGSETASRGEDRLAVVRVPDERVDRLSRMFEPQKTIYAQVDYFLAGQGSQKKEANPWLPVKDCDALIQVVRNHGPDRTPAADFRAVEQELILSDLVQVEKRLA